MKRLLLVTAVLEAAAGLALLGYPSAVARLLFGVPFEVSVALAVARIGGVGLLALGVAAWFAAHDVHNGAARGLVSAMVLYNLGAVIILGVAGLQSPFVGLALWPGVFLHTAMAVWCVATLLRVPPETKHPS